MPVHVEVVDFNGPVTVGSTTAQKLNHIKLNWPITTEIESGQASPTKVKHPCPPTKEYLLKEYEDVLTGIGCFPSSPYLVCHT